MRKHRSLGEMISTATFVGCGLFILLHSMELLDNGKIFGGISGLLLAAFVFWVGFALPSQIWSQNGEVIDG